MLTGGRSCGSMACVLGVAGASEDDAVSRESIDGVRLDERADDLVRECCSDSLAPEEERWNVEEGRDTACESGERLMLEVGLGRVRASARDGRSSRFGCPMTVRRESRADGK